MLASLNLLWYKTAESNIGRTYSIVKIIRGSFRQDNPRFGYKA